MAKKKQDRSTYGMIDLNKLDKEATNSLSMVEYKKTNFIKKLLSKIRSLLKN